MLYLICISLSYPYSYISPPPLFIKKHKKAPKWGPRGTEKPGGPSFTNGE